MARPGDYRKPKGYDFDEWLNWVGFEIAVRLGKAKRRDQRLPSLDGDGVDVDLESLFDEFFDEYDEMKFRLDVGSTK